MIASVNEASSGPMITHLSGLCESINPLIHAVVLSDLIPVVAEKVGFANQLDRVRSRRLKSVDFQV